MLRTYCLRSKATPRRAPRILPRLLRLESRAVPATFTVSNLNDLGAGSLRQAVLDANAAPGADSIQFAVSGTVALVSQITITETVTITGLGVSTNTVSGGDLTRIFTVNVGAGTVTLDGLRLTRGKSPGGGAILNTSGNITINNSWVIDNTSTGGAGGAIASPNSGLITIFNANISGNTAEAGNGGALSGAGSTSFLIDATSINNNSASGSGGAIWLGGASLTLTRSTITGNRAVNGGGISSTVGSVSVTDTDIFNNVATSNGGGIHVAGAVTISNSTLRKNTGTQGGAVFLENSPAQFLFRNSTVSTNTAAEGGGIRVLNSNTTLQLLNSTVTANTATVDGGGLHRAGGFGTIELDSTILSGNGDAGGNSPDALNNGSTFGYRNSAVGSLTGITAINDKGGNLAPGTDLKLGPLANNGGFRLTHRPAIDSPVIDAGNNLAGLVTDQRGQTRVSGPAADIGAVEYAMTVMVSNAADAGPGSLRQAILDTNNDPGQGTVTFDAAGVFASAASITLTSGQLPVNDAVVIQGPGPDRLTIDAKLQSRVISTIGAPDGAAITLQGMTLTGGSSAINGGGIYAGDESLTLLNMVVAGNTSANNGGGIFFQSTGAGSLARLVVDASTVSGNTAKSDGGGIYFFDGGSFLIRDSSVTGNQATSGTGGGLYFFGPLGALGAEIVQSTFSGNVAAGAGGAVGLFGSATTGTVNFINAAVVDNSASTGGGIARVGGSATISLLSSIVSGNSGTQPDVALTTGLVAVGGSALGSTAGLPLFDAGSNILNQPHATLLLGPLVASAEPGRSVHMPSAESPLIDAGGNALGLLTDQLGNDRSVGNQPDMGPVEARNLIVVNANNSGAGSLRQALQHASSNNFNGTVSFDLGLHGTTITLTSEIAITDSVSISGPGVGQITLSGGNATRLFNVTGSGTAFGIANATLSQGSASTGGAVLGGPGTSLNFTSCVLADHRASGDGGAIATTGNLTLSDAHLTGNSAATGGSGAGGAVWSNGSVSIIGCSWVGNRVIGNGGGTGHGGGLSLNGGFGKSWTIRNSTFEGNVARTSGGGIAMTDADALFFVQNSTIVGNTAQGATGGGGIARLNIGTPSNSINLESSIISGNSGTGAPDVFSSGLTNVKTSAVGSPLGFTKTDQGGNLPDGTPLLLGPLQNNGGTTQSRLPLLGSPLIDVGSNPAMLTADQRGGPRVIGSAADIGATEIVSLVVFHDGDAGFGSLRQAVQHANSSPGPDTITFDSGFAMTDTTITLTSGELVVSDDLTVMGPGAKAATVSGNSASRIFSGGNIALAVSGLTLTAGLAPTDGGAIAVSDGSLTVTDAVFTNNTATNNGGAIMVSSSHFSLIRSTLSNNSAVSGGGLRIQLLNPGQSATVVASTLTGNRSSISGGAILLTGSSTVSVINSTISGNTAGLNGGGIRGYATFSGTLHVLNSTITQNTLAGTGQGRGISHGAGTFNITSSIVAQNTGGSAATGDVSGPVNADLSLIGANNGATIIGANNLTGTNASPLDALLGPLADNGGPTPTHALLAGSPALNAGSNPSNLNADQRGLTRVAGLAADIGSFEVQAAKVTGLVVGDGTAQRSMVTSIKVTFDSPVTFVGAPASAFTLTRNTDAAGVTLAAAVSGNDVTLTFTGGAVDGKSLADGRYTIGILANQIAGAGFDGDGNGTSGDDYSLVGDLTNQLFRLFGDADGNGTVNPADFLAFRLAFLSSSPVFDFDDDGSVRASDFLAFRLRFLASV